MTAKQIQTTDYHTANAQVATVLGSIPASVGTVESEGRQMKQCCILYEQKEKNPPKKYFKKKTIILLLLNLWKQTTSKRLPNKFEIAANVNEYDNLVP